MIFFDPAWGGLDVVQDTPPYDGLAISYLPSIVNDALAGQLQYDSQESARSYMQEQFRAAAENMYETGLVITAQG